MKVVIIYRQRLPGAHSIEELFHAVAGELTKEVEVIEYEASSPWLVLFDAWQLRKLKADIYHVTAAINYIVLLLPRKKTVLTVPDIGHYLFLGSGDFHPIGLVLHTGKPLAMLDPYSGDAEEMSFERIERILRQRFGLIIACDQAKTFGILIGEKPGQMRRTLALRMKKILEKHGKKGYLLALEHVGPELIDFYPVDAFVNTACPRIAIDDSVRYAKPLITPFELEVALGEKKWEMGYQFDEIP